jgi:hypothetical protein
VPFARSAARLLAAGDRSDRALNANDAADQDPVDPDRVTGKEVPSDILRLEISGRAQECGGRNEKAAGAPEAGEGMSKH